MSGKRTAREREGVMAADRLVDIEGAADFLGVAVGTLYHMVSQHRVPCIRLSKRCLRFRLADLLKLIDEKFVPAK